MFIFSFLNRAIYCVVSSSSVLTCQLSISVCFFFCFSFDSIRNYKLKRSIYFSNSNSYVSDIVSTHSGWIYSTHIHTGSTQQKKYLCIYVAVFFTVQNQCNIIIAERSIQQKRIILFDHFYSYIRSKRIVLVFIVPRNFCDM